MSKEGPERREQLFDALLIALGVSDPLVRYVVTQDLEYIERAPGFVFTCRVGETARS